MDKLKRERPPPKAGTKKFVHPSPPSPLKPPMGPRKPRKQVELL